MTKGNYYYTQDGLYVRLAEEITVNKRTSYIVVDEQEEPDGDGGTNTYEYVFVTDKLFEKLESTPTAIRQSDLQKQVVELHNKKVNLEKEVKELQAAKTEISNDFRPAFKPGDKVYTVNYNGVIEQSTVSSVSFTLYKDSSSLTYSGGYSLTAIRPFATKEEAEVESARVKADREAYEKKSKLQAYQAAKKIVETYESNK